MTPNTSAETIFPGTNEEHRHSGIAFLTPQSVHNGTWQPIVAAKQQTLDCAYQRFAQRFPNGKPTAPKPPAVVYINKPLENTPPAGDLLQPTLSEIIAVDGQTALQDQFPLSANCSLT